MLEEIRIRGLGVIDDAQLEFGSGLTVVTGETGAGKTMVLTGLGLLMGGRADAGAVRAGVERAVVEGRVSLGTGDAAERAAERAAEAGAELEDGELLLSRTVLAGGRSRAHVGGRGAPVSLLGELADDLVAVHGQSDQQRLLRASRQLNALDRYAGDAVAVPFAEYSVRYARLRAVESELDEVTSQARERVREAEQLRQGLEEIESVDPQPGEDAALQAEEERLGHADALRTAAESAHQCLSADDTVSDQTDATNLLALARHALDGERDHDPDLASLADRLAEAAYLVGDVAADLASYASSVDTDPERLAAVQQRRATLTALTRKYGDDIDEVLRWAQTGSQRLLELDGDDERVAALREERETLRAELGELAATITGARTDAAARFAEDVGAELTALAMPHARIVVDVRPRDELTATGADEVEILFSAHHGAQPRSLDKGASGGELSRLMLAVEVVFAGADPVPTFVFDEVDAGVGGKAAVEVGSRLAKLARHAQVLVVTHLPQVAAFADRHLKVVKADDGRVTTSGVEVLDESGRVGELSRMLAGLEDSASARAHAEELLATAAASKDAAAV
ncbi:DNA replication and repair protein RecN [Haloactinopolyspora alba]|uniref:DNA repair protein RecN n=1 Tax=Haloactinopolyspora alba TaxID=648780 RepID=A0A2P8E228_9ACTN|nr:DNA repair protein RecN [Haloactinopolyspora alba]PSL03530.1 DNA replication and repair protein RecN [Haloactinopolyspora alba]